MRTEPCLCGGLITAPSLKVSQPYVEAHNSTIAHLLWRALTFGWVTPRPDFDPALERERLMNHPPAYLDPRRRPTAGTKSRDLSGNKPGASAGVEGKH